MIRLHVLAALAALLIAPATAQPRTPAGRWLTEDGGGVIEISARGDALFGRIVGMLQLAPNEAPVDHQGKPRCGLEFIQALVENPPGEWYGKITNPEDGRVWDVRVTVDQAGNLRLRGFLVISLLGSTQVWKPYAGTLGPDCRPAP